MLSRFLIILLAVAGFTSCTTSEENSMEEADASMEAAVTSEVDAAVGTAADASTAILSDSDRRERNNRRLRLVDSIDQWWSALQRQEYAKSDGLERALEQFVGKYYDEFVADLSHQNPRWRKVAATGLGFNAKPEAVAPLMRTLRDPVADVVEGGLLSLGRLAQAEIPIDATEITPYLGHVNPYIRSNASLVLVHATKPGQGELFLPLTAAMEDSEPSVRNHVAAALGALGDPDAVPFLLKGLKDPKALVRVRAAFALALIDDKRAVPGLIESLDDASEEVSKAAHKALRRMTGQKFERRRELWEPYWDSRKTQG